MANADVTDSLCAKITSRLRTWLMIIVETDLDTLVEQCRLHDPHIRAEFEHTQKKTAEIKAAQTIPTAPAQTHCRQREYGTPQPSTPLSATPSTHTATPAPEPYPRSPFYMGLLAKAPLEALHCSRWWKWDDDIPVWARGHLDDEKRQHLDEEDHCWFSTAPATSLSTTPLLAISTQRSVTTSRW